MCVWGGLEQAQHVRTYLLKVCHIIKITFLKELFFRYAKLVVAGREEGIDVAHIGHLYGGQSQKG